MQPRIVPSPQRRVAPAPVHPFVKQCGVQGTVSLIAEGLSEQSSRDSGARRVYRLFNGRRDKRVYLQRVQRSAYSAYLVPTRLRREAAQQERHCFYAKTASRSGACVGLLIAGSNRLMLVFIFKIKGEISEKRLSSAHYCRRFMETRTLYQRSKARKEH